MIIDFLSFLTFTLFFVPLCRGSSFPTSLDLVCRTRGTDGWTYTTDTWTHPRPDARPSDGWVTRRRRWVRRVYSKGVER